MAAMAVTCGGKAIDVKQEMQITDVTTGWFDVGIVEDGKNKLVPSISFRLKNVSDRPIASVQVMLVFRRVGEQDEWDSVYAKGVGPEGLKPGAMTVPLVLRSTHGYTGLQPRAQMLQNSEFVDAMVKIMAKQGSAQWVQMGDYKIERLLLTR
jgi:hypothetical protein